VTQAGHHIDDDLLSAFVDDELAAEEVAHVQSHVVSCVECQARIDEFRTVRDLLRKLPSLTPPREFTLGPRLIVDPPNVVQMRRWFRTARTAAAALAAIWIGLSAGALYVDFGSQPSAGAVGLAQPQVASAPVPAAQNAAAATAQSPRAAVPAAAVAKPVPPAAPVAQAGAALARPSASPQPDDQVAAATSVNPLPTPVPAVQPTAIPPPLPVAARAGTSDPAAPLRTAAIVVGLLTLLSLFATFLMWRRIKQAAAQSQPSS